MISEEKLKTEEKKKKKYLRKQKTMLHNAKSNRELDKIVMTLYLLRLPWQSVVKKIRCQLYESKLVLWDAILHNCYNFVCACEREAKAMEVCFVNSTALYK